MKDNIEKGGKAAVLGEKRMFGGREYIKTMDGWKFHGKGTGAKAQGHAAAHSSEKKEDHSKTQSGKEIKHSNADSYQDFSSQDHRDAMSHHYKMSDEENRKGNKEKALEHANAADQHAKKAKDVEKKSSIKEKTQKLKDLQGGKKKTNSFEDVLADPEGKRMVEGIEGLDKNRLDHLPLFKLYQKDLKDNFGYDYQSEDWDKTAQRASIEEKTEKLKKVMDKKVEQPKKDKQSNVPSKYSKEINAILSPSFISNWNATEFSKIEEIKWAPSGSLDKEYCLQFKFQNPNISAYVMGEEVTSILNKFSLKFGNEITNQHYDNDKSLAFIHFNSK